MLTITRLFSSFYIHSPTCFDNYQVVFFILYTPFYVFFCVLETLHHTFYGIGNSCNIPINTTFSGMISSFNIKFILSYTGSKISNIKTRFIFGEKCASKSSLSFVLILDLPMQTIHKKAVIGTIIKNSLDMLQHCIGTLSRFA